MDGADSREPHLGIEPSTEMFHQQQAAAESETLTIAIAVGGRDKRMIMAANNMPLFDRAYARRAEKAGDRFGSAGRIFYSDGDIGPTANCR